LTSPLVALRELWRLCRSGLGLLAGHALELLIYANSSLLDEHSHLAPEVAGVVPDIEIMPIAFNTRDPDLEDVFRSGPEGGLSLLCITLQPKSHGTVRLASTDPRDRPLCDLRTLSAPEDIYVARKAVRLGLAIMERLKKQGYPIRPVSVPASTSDEDIDKYIRSVPKSTYHYSSTCRMAPPAEGGVVDAHLRVHDLQGLRVVDASVFPRIPAGHLQAPTVMLAHRCAELIMQEIQEKNP
jgi:choline dehydrogenase